MSALLSVRMFVCGSSLLRHSALLPCDQQKEKKTALCLFACTMQHSPVGHVTLCGICPDLMLFPYNSASVTGMPRVCKVLQEAGCDPAMLPRVCNFTQ